MLKFPAVRRFLRLLLGFLLVILGIIGGFVPILQGWMFMIPGLLILSEFFPPVKRLVDWAKAKYHEKTGKSFDPAPQAGRERDCDEPPVKSKEDA